MSRRRLGTTKGILPRRAVAAVLALATLAPGLRGEDTPALVVRLGQAVARGELGEAREVLEARWRTASGHTPALLYLLGRVRERSGDREGAVRVYRSASFLAPDAAAVRHAMERLGAWPHPPASPLLRELGPLPEAARRAHSLVWCGKAREALELVRKGRGPQVLAARASALGELGRFEEAEVTLAALDQLQPGRALTPFLRANFAHWRGDTELEGRLLDLAEEWHPGSPEVRGARAARAVAAGRSAEVRRFLEEDAAGPHARDPYRWVGRAALWTALGEVARAREELVGVEEAYPPSPQTLVVRAGLELRSGAIEAGVAALDALVDLAPGNMLLVPAANLLASVGRPDLARRAAEGLDPPLRHDPRVRHMLGLLSADGDPEEAALEGRRGAFAYQAAPGTPAAVLRRALVVLARARGAVDARLGTRGPEPVALRLVFTPEETPWGYYDAVTRRMVFRGDFRDERLQGRTLEVLRHVARHEYAHLAFDHRVRGDAAAVVSYPRWMMEGLADRLAGGVGYLEDYGYDLGSLARRPMDVDELARVLAAPVLGMGTIPQGDQARAYRQAHAMIGVLLERLDAEDPWEAMAGLVRRLGAGEDLEEVLAECCGLGLEALVRAATATGR